MYSVFFLRIRRPPRSTLFPTRRSSDLSRRFLSGTTRVRCSKSFSISVGSQWTARKARRRGDGSSRPRARYRSEEHTSELQSRRDLVCRLLLEKKKQTHTADTLDVHHLV